MHEFAFEYKTKKQEKQTSQRHGRRQIHGSFNATSREAQAQQLIDFVILAVVVVVEAEERKESETNKKQFRFFEFCVAVFCLSTQEKPKVFAQTDQ